MKILKRLAVAVGGLLAVAVLALWLMGFRPGAGHIEGSVEIARSPAVVWAWVTDADKQKQWIGWLVEIRKIDDRRAIWVMEDRNNGNQMMEIEGDIYESNPPKYVKGRLSAKSAFTGESQYRLTDLGGGRTRMEQIGDYHFESWFHRLLEPLIMPQAKKKMIEDLERLKQKVESDGV